MWVKLVTITTLFICIVEIEPSRILAASCVATKSHKYVFMPLVEALARRGHEVVIITPFKPEKKIANLTELVIDNLESVFEENDWFEKAKAIKNKGFSFTPLSDILGEIEEEGVRTTLTSVAFKELYGSEGFDILIVDAYGSEFLLPLASKWNAPVISFIPSMFIPASITRRMGGIVDHLAAFGNTEKIPSFVTRLIAYLIGNLFDIDWSINLGSMIELLMKELYPNDIMTSLTELEKMTDLVFINGHYSLNLAQSLPPNMRNVGGLHCKESEDLPQDIEEFISDGDEGVILFSLGSAIPSEQMPKQYLDAFANAFRRLPQKIIWRWSGEPFENVPENVMLRSWLPQQDIAGHPKTRLLISHGGMLSTTEAICHGIPILGLPFWGDQDANIALAVRDGYGLKLEWNDLTEDLLYNTITELLNNTQYTRIVKKRQELFHDRPMKPLDEAVYWVEHILRHGGGQHLSPATRNLNRFQAKMLDVYLFLLGAVSIILILIAGSLYALLSIVRRFISPQLKQKLN
ncbi:UDP-glycosyltransferase UGT5-like isoform X1 [Artemia franciscana]